MNSANAERVPGGAVSTPRTFRSSRFERSSLCSRRPDVVFPLSLPHSLSVVARSLRASLTCALRCLCLLSACAHAISFARVPGGKNYLRASSDFRQGRQTSGRAGQCPVVLISPYTVLLCTACMFMKEPCSGAVLGLNGMHVSLFVVCMPGNG